MDRGETKQDHELVLPLGKLRLTWELYRPNFGNTIAIQTGEIDCTLPERQTLPAGPASHVPILPCDAQTVYDWPPCTCRCQRGVGADCLHHRKCIGGGSLIRKVLLIALRVLC